MKTQEAGVMVVGALVVLGTGFVAGSNWQAGRTAAGRPAGPVIAQPTDLNEDESHTIALFERAAPSVVYITSLAVRRDFRNRNVSEIPQGTGSGFVWDTDGHVVTNYHVIRGADAARVTLSDHSTYDAELVGAAPEKDLAVLKIDVNPSSLQPLPVGESSVLRVGQQVYAIGNPFGLDHTLTTGVISAIGREIESTIKTPIRDVIQTDAAINPGNSGGPLIDSSGRLIGVNTSIYSPSGASAGIGFSIPVDNVSWVVPQLIEHGRVMRPTLGIEVAVERLAERLGIDGVLVINVAPGSGAEAAGIRPTRRDIRGRVMIGDIIVAIDGESVSSFGDMLLILERFAAGDRVVVTIRRDGQERDVEVTLRAGA